MPRTTLAFSDGIAFSRPVSADYIDASGAVVSAAPNEARLTHDPAGGHALLGLLVEGVEENFAPDLAVLAVDPAGWVTSDQRHTVLHHWYDDGTERWDCHFADADKVEDLVDGVLRTKGVFAQACVLPVLPTDIADDPNATRNLVRDGDAVTWKGIPTHVGPPDQAWTVQTALLTSAPLEHVLSAPGERVITGASE